MRRSAVVWLTAALAWPAAAVTSEEVRQKRTEFVNACQGWRSADATLEADLATRDPDILLARIDEAKKKADQCSAARAEYLRAAAAQTAPSLVSARTPVIAELDADLKKQQSNLLNAIRELNTQIESLSGTGNASLLRETAQRQRTALLSIQNLLVEQALALSEAGDKVESPSQPITAGAALLNRILDDYKSDTSVEQETDLRRRYYAGVADLTRRRKEAIAAAAVKRVEPPPAPRPAQPTQPVVTAPVSTPSVTPSLPATPHTIPREWAGTWAYSSSRPIFSGEEPEKVEVKVTPTQNGMIIGSFSARFKLKKGDRRIPTAAFDFSGPARGSGTQRFAITGGGYIELLKGPTEQSLEIVWKRPDSATTVSSGDVVLVRR